MMHHDLVCNCNQHSFDHGIPFFGFDFYTSYKVALQISAVHSLRKVCLISQFLTGGDAGEHIPASPV